MDNLTNAMKLGKEPAFILDEISKLKTEREALDQQIRVEEYTHPIITEKQVRFFMEQFRTGDINDPKYRKA